ncbi:RNA recognition motif (A.K.A RRM, RBD, or RNP domain) protein [Gregarina niphandrodes]|uniref:RNA recognition motif (A.K.A RRM, RBD, or RNP domain) protein n=1 Tax=Gregarina niphandrodes TaxID=110365 RepID=A0A023B1P3_GRENI|nr:RNA recognition motif (A.K.A RRM, RBD, or RNP domain) protein [Gregarina niphandrodes]EZG47203.1 RNA recognition motif (A.K.A RRM, RBD, or RNP domain) protein [Gregarina niphandrodes]|eukprot:XP_011132198.1 RNA recognition motif (A.K.A RRM, RBD, or RNP domain) protein [Gregarina niphandrodes]
MERGVQGSSAAAPQRRGDVPVGADVAVGTLVGGDASVGEETVEEVEWLYTERFLALEKLPLLPEYCAMPATLRVFMRHDYPPTARELRRPARVQRREERVAYVEGRSVNVWYGYSATGWTPDGRRERVPAAGHCRPLVDAGFTQADLRGAGRAPLCLFFARGLCTGGVNCQFFHRVPTLYESEQLPLTLDIFGRERFAQHKEDMGGVGSFNSTSLTLFVGDYLRSEDLAAIERQLRAAFSVYGALRNVKVVANRNYSFVTYCYRAAAEFALVAMNGWKLVEDEPSEVLTVRWATGKEIARHVGEG